MKILSLFDWASCWQQALTNLWITDYTYFASEIDKFPIQVTQNNFPQTKHIWNVIKISYWFKQWSRNSRWNWLYWEPKSWLEDTMWKIDKFVLLLWWSPCTNLSFAWKQKGLVIKENIEITTLEQYLDLKSKWFEFEWQSYLFWEFIRILHEIKPRYFLLENVVMSKKWEQVFNQAVWFESVKINSSLVVAQNRKRLYWVWELQKDWTYKKVEISQPEDRWILLKDILEENVDEKFYLSNEYIERIKNRKATQKPLNRLLEKESKSHCLTARGAWEDHSWMILYKQENIRINDFSKFNQDNVFCWKDDKVPTLTAGDWQLRPKILIPEATKKGYVGIKPWECFDYTHPNSVLMDEKSKYRIRKLTPIECERLQGWKDNYTQWVSDSQRYKMLWNGWTVPVIEHILKHLDLK